MLVLTTRSASLSGALVASSKIKAGVRGRSPRVALGRRRGVGRTRRCGFGSRAIGFTCEEPSGPRDRLGPHPAFRFQAQLRRAFALAIA